MVLVLILWTLRSVNVALLKIAQIGEPVLRLRADEVTHAEISSPKIQTLIDDMIQTMRDANGAGIAANQV